MIAARSVGALQRYSARSACAIVGCALRWRSQADVARTAQNEVGSPLDGCGRDVLVGFVRGVAQDKLRQSYTGKHRDAHLGGADASGPD